MYPLKAPIYAAFRGLFFAFYTEILRFYDKLAQKNVCVAFYGKLKLVEKICR